MTAPGLSMLPLGVAFAGIAASVAWVLLWLLLGLLGLALAALLLAVSLPLHLQATGAVADDALRGALGARWAWGVLALRWASDRRAGRPTLHLLGLRIWTFRGRRAPTEEDMAKRKRKEKKEKKEKRRAKRRASAARRAERRRARGARRDRGWVWRHRETLWDLLRRLARSLRLRLRIKGAVGTGDPADTAALWSLRSALPAGGEAVRLEVEPDWLDTRLELQGCAGARLWGLSLVALVLGALLRRDTWRMLRDARGRRPRARSDAAPA